MTTVPFILRDHREELWRRWAEALDERVAADYRELVGSALGERMTRAFVDDLCAVGEAEDYELPALLRQVEERVAGDAGYRLSLGFSTTDVVVSLQALRVAVVGVLLDALVLDELPSFADTLEQLRDASALLDRMVCAVLTVP